MQKKVLIILIISLAFLQSTSCKLVEIITCPNQTKYSNCLKCFSVESYYIDCLCSKNDARFMGQCIAVSFPCRISLISDFNTNFTGEYDIWYDILSLILNDVFYQARMRAGQMDFIPQYLNDLRFVTMPDQYRYGWVQAYYFYKIFQKQIEHYITIQNTQTIYQLVNLYQSMKLDSWEGKWIKILEFGQTKFGFNYTLSKFKRHVMTEVLKYISCSDCRDDYNLQAVSGAAGVLPYCKRPQPNCVVYKNFTQVCISCQYGFYYSNNICKPCLDENCRQCYNNSGTCLRCNFGFQLISGNCISQTSIASAYCSPSCQQCGSSEQENCTQCFPYFYNIFPISSSCQISNCKTSYTYLQKIYCRQCMPGYGMNRYNDKCTQCPYQCVYCSGDPNEGMSCSSCIHGYTLAQNFTCVKMNQYVPPIGCFPINQTACHECNVYFQLLKQNFGCVLNQQKIKRVEACSPGCQFCYPDNYAKCKKCANGYFMKYQFYCSRCIDGCQNCRNATGCTQCFPGYVLNGGVCTKCIQNCMKCFNTSQNSCLFCRNGYYLANQQCVKKIDINCFRFNVYNQTECLLCNIGYTISSTGVCIACQADCYVSCNASNISHCSFPKQYLRRYYEWLSYKIDVPEEGCYYYMSDFKSCFLTRLSYTLKQINGTIVITDRCFYPCMTCDPEAISTCFECDTGYNLVNGSCIPILTCNQSLECTSCPSAMYLYLNQSGGICLSCQVPNCGSCLSICIECIRGYFLKDENTCQKCPTQCRTCVSSEICTTCAKGYFAQLIFQQMIGWNGRLTQLITYNSQNYCYPCSPNCKTCKFSAILCTSCPTGQQLFRQKCILINNRNVSFTLQLNINYTTFLAESQAQNFIQQLATYLNVTVHQIVVTQVSQGSTVVNGLVASDKILSVGVMNGLQSCQLPSFPVLAASSVIVNADGTQGIVPVPDNGGGGGSGGGGDGSGGGGGSDGGSNSDGTNGQTSDIQDRPVASGFILSTGASVGIALGCVAFIGIMAAVVVLVVKKLTINSQRTWLQQNSVDIKVDSSQLQQDQNSKEVGSQIITKQEQVKQLESKHQIIV